MFKNYFKIAFRNLTKNKLLSTINILGLAIGFMVAILSYLYIENESNYDKWIPDNDLIYRVYRQSPQEDVGGWTYTPGPLAPTLAHEIAGVDQATKVFPENEQLFSVGDKSIYLEHIAYVDSTFFQVFPFKFKEGNPKTAMMGHTNVVLTERIGKLFFGEENPIGKTVRINGTDDFLISGILENPEGQSYIDQEVFVTLWSGAENQWLSNNFSTYLKRDRQSSIEQIEERTNDFLYPIYSREYAAINIPFQDKKDIHRWKFQPLADIHLNSEQFSGMRDAQGDVDRLFIFGFIALIVLLIAGINYINLATAKGALRAKEVGMRKVSGAQKGQLVTQFLLESVMQSLFALGMALVLSEFFLPIFNNITNRELSFFGGDWLSVLPLAIFSSLIIGIIAGLYPAFFLSQYEPIKVLKSNILKSEGGQMFRKVLVVGQFALSVSLIIVMVFVFKQVNFMQNQDLGFNEEQVMVVSMNRWDSWRKFEQIQTKFEQISGVESIAMSNELPGKRPGNYTLNIEGKEEDVRSADMLFISGAFDKTIGLEMSEGRFFGEEHALDTISNWVVNEAFLADNNITEPIGNGLKYVFENEYGRIIGVVKDFHFTGLQNKIAPMAMTARRNMEWYYKASFKLKPNNIKRTISEISELWTAVEPEHPIRYTFLDERFSKQYKENESFGLTMLSATAIAIFIAMLGLFGLAAFMAEQRRKEIGVRKVLGASIPNLIQLLVKDFVKLVLIAGVIATPFGYFLVEKWLQDFAYTTDINATPFILAILSALILAILTVSYQSIKVSTANPIKALKSE